MTLPRLSEILTNLRIPAGCPHCDATRSWTRAGWTTHHEQPEGPRMRITVIGTLADYELSRLESKRLGEQERRRRIKAAS